MPAKAQEETLEATAGNTVIAVFLLSFLALLGLYLFEEWRTENWLHFHGWPLFWRFAVAVTVLYVLLFTPLMSVCDGLRQQGEAARELPVRMVVLIFAGVILVGGCSSLGGGIVYAGRLVGYVGEGVNEWRAARAREQAKRDQPKADCAMFLKLMARNQISFVTKEELPRNLGQPAKPKFIIVDSGLKPGDVIDEWNYLLIKPELRPRTPDEVGTVAWRQWSETAVKEYASGRHGYVQHCKVTVIDWATKTVIAEQSFSGQEPPDNPNMRRSSSYTGYFGAQRTIDFINQLPLADEAK